MKRNQFNTTACGGCGRRLASKRKRTHCSPACRNLSAIADRKRRKPAEPAMPINFRHRLQVFDLIGMPTARGRSRP